MRGTSKGNRCEDSREDRKVYCQKKRDMTRSERIAEHPMLRQANRRMFVKETLPIFFM